jgi:hypothetical protein
LATSLLELHNNKIFSQIESLSGVISLNHDNLFQLASQKVYKSVNLGFEFQSDYFKNDNTNKIPAIIQLHGSFNWKNILPIEVSRLNTRADTLAIPLWIPPTILKRI